MEYPNTRHPYLADSLPSNPCYTAHNKMKFLLNLYDILGQKIPMIANILPKLAYMTTNSCKQNQPNEINISSTCWCHQTMDLAYCYYTNLHRQTCLIIIVHLALSGRQMPLCSLALFKSKGSIPKGVCCHITNQSAQIQTERLKFMNLFFIL